MFCGCRVRGEQNGHQNHYNISFCRYYITITELCQRWGLNIHSCTLIDCNNNRMALDDAEMRRFLHFISKIAGLVESVVVCVCAEVLNCENALSIGLTLESRLWIYVKPNRKKNNCVILQTISGRCLWIYLQPIPQAYGRGIMYSSQDKRKGIRWNCSWRNPKDNLLYANAHKSRKRHPNNKSIYFQYIGSIPETPIEKAG